MRTRTLPASVAPASSRIASASRTCGSVVCPYRVTSTVAWQRVLSTAASTTGSSPGPSITTTS
ncbi:hypothetical protein BJF78_19640 [Pseudonocardia sp. CNS-139]|nr:hypothetical protein BJF78_19640 [Pseudonocardia sp. CNS-139]